MLTDVEYNPTLSGLRLRLRRPGRRRVEVAAHTPAAFQTFVLSVDASRQMEVDMRTCAAPLALVLFTFFCVALAPASGTPACDCPQGCLTGLSFFGGRLNVPTVYP